MINIVTLCIIIGSVGGSYCLYRYCTQDNASLPTNKSDRYNQLKMKQRQAYSEESYKNKIEKTEEEKENDLNEREYANEKRKRREQKIKEIREESLKSNSNKEHNIDELRKLLT